MRLAGVHVDKILSIPLFPLLLLYDNSAKLPFDFFDHVAIVPYAIDECDIASMLVALV